MTPDQFHTWLATAKPGDMCIYHKGRHLQEGGSEVGIAAREAAGYRYRRQTSTDVYLWEQRGPRLVNLVQQRVGRGFHYIAQRVG